MFINGKTQKMKNMNQVIRNPQRNTCACTHAVDLGYMHFTSFVTTCYALTSSRSASGNKKSMTGFRIKAFLIFWGRWTVRRKKWMQGLGSLPSSRISSNNILVA